MNKRTLRSTNFEGVERSKLLGILQTDLDDFEKEYNKWTPPPPPTPGKWIKEIHSQFDIKNIQGFIGCCL